MIVTGLSYESPVFSANMAFVIHFYVTKTGFNSFFPSFFFAWYRVSSFFLLGFGGSQLYAGRDFYH